MIAEAAADQRTDFYSHVRHFTQERTQTQHRLPTYNFSVEWYSAKKLVNSRIWQQSKQYFSTEINNSLSPQFSPRRIHTGSGFNNTLLCGEKAVALIPRSNTFFHMSGSMVSIQFFLIIFLAFASYNLLPYIQLVFGSSVIVHMQDIPAPLQYSFPDNKV